MFTAAGTKPIQFSLQRADLSQKVAMIFIVYRALYLYSYVFICAIILIMMRAHERKFFSMLLSPSRNRPLKTLAMPRHLWCSIRGANRE